MALVANELNQFPSLKLRRLGASEKHKPDPTSLAQQLFSTQEAIERIFKAPLRFSC